MQTETVEFRFPDGDFEIDATEHVPRFGEVVAKRGRVWKVDEILPGNPPLLMLQPAPPREPTPNA
jgi:hypothetical protein